MRYDIPSVVFDGSIERLEDGQACEEVGNHEEIRHSPLAKFFWVKL